MANENLNLVIPPGMAGKRLDQALAELCPQHSRSRLQAWIKNGYVKVDDVFPKQRDIVLGGENIRIKAQIEAAVTENRGEEIPLNILYADDHIIIIDKPHGLVVHPGAGNTSHTLLNALLFHYPELQRLPRAGIIQRLDKDTSGIMIITRSLTAHTCLVDRLQKREIKREYQAVVCGTLTAGGTISASIGRHPYKRTLMAVVENGKEATTHYRIIKKFPGHTHLRVQLESGRTHQIRVHMAHIKHPLVGDPVYGGRLRFPKNTTESLRQVLATFPRQALHASKLELKHPETGEPLVFEAPLPDDFQQLLKALDQYVDQR